MIGKEIALANFERGEKKDDERALSIKMYMQIMSEYPAKL